VKWRYRNDLRRGSIARNPDQGKSPRLNCRCELRAARHALSRALLRYSPDAATTSAVAAQNDASRSHLVAYSRLVQSFRRIRAWRKAHALLLACHPVLRRMPREYASLRSQLRRAVESVATNIVEGSGCESQKEFARFLQHSINSADETEYHLLLARDYRLLTHREWTQLTSDIRQTRAMTISLRRKILFDLGRAQDL
jgi:four helix bundle protein